MLSIMYCAAGEAEHRELWYAMPRGNEQQELVLIPKAMGCALWCMAHGVSKTWGRRRSGACAGSTWERPD